MTDNYKEEKYNGNRGVKCALTYLTNTRVNIGILENVNDGNIGTQGTLKISSQSLDFTSCFPCE